MGSQLPISNRAMAKTLGVSKDTVRLDLVADGENSPPAESEPLEIKAAAIEGGENSPPPAKPEW